jgi:hypothetical protein
MLKPAEQTALKNTLISWIKELIALAEGKNQKSIRSSLAEVQGKLLDDGISKRVK